MQANNEIQLNQDPENVARQIIGDMFRDALQRKVAFDSLKAASFNTSFYGLEQLLIRSGVVESVRFGLEYVNDTHLSAVTVIAKTEDGDVSHSFTREEIEDKCTNHSAKKLSGLWLTHYDQMARNAAFKMFCMTVLKEQLEKVSILAD